MELVQKFIIDSIVPWLSTSGIKILIIVAVVYFIRRFVSMLIERVIWKLIIADQLLEPESEKKREDTLIRVFDGAARILIWIVAALTILAELGISLGPILTAAGIAGLAFGFGGQYLIRDVIAGLFIILENQYRVGDVACVDGTCGLVENITLRMTTMRDLDGTVHNIPNGAITKASNLTKDFSRVNLDIGIAYDSDLEKVIAVINQVGKEMAEDSVWSKDILKPPVFLRVNDFADSAIILKILGETKPLRQWDVTGELRKRLKIAFDKEEIEIPFPQRVIHQSK